MQEATSASKKLQTLALGGNRISDPGLTAISNSMAPALSTLNFNFNCVADDGATSLVPIFSFHVRSVSTSVLDATELPKWRWRAVHLFMQLSLGF